MSSGNSDTKPLDLRELGPEWDTEWDALAGSCPESGFMQSSAWSRFKALEGYRCSRVGLFRDGRLESGASLLEYGHDGNSGYIICPEGPVIPWHDPACAREALKKIQAAVHLQAATHGALGFRIEPHISPPRPSLLRNWSRAPVDLTPQHTLILNVTQPDDALLAAMHPKARYNLGVAMRHEVQITKTSDMNALARFYPLFAETAHRGDFFAEPYGFFLNLGAALFSCNMACLFLAEWNGQLLAAILVVFFGIRATYLYGASASTHRHVMPNHALHWHAIQEARRRGCLQYDFYGYDPFSRPGHQYAGISRFKRQWGGVRHDWIGAYDLIFYDQLADRLVERLAAR